jgi:hypothetical protein
MRADEPEAPERPVRQTKPIVEKLSVPADEPKVGRTAHTTTVLGLAGGADEEASWKLLVQAAHGLAEEQSTTVAIVGLFTDEKKTSFVTDIVGVESAEELPAIPPQTSDGGAEGVAEDMLIARALHRLRPAVGLWIVVSPPPTAKAFAAIGSIVPEWLLACPTDNDGLVAGYQYLKEAWTRIEPSKDREVTPTVYLLSEDYARAAVVHKRLRKAAREFLGTDLALAGAGPIRHRAGGNGSGSAAHGEAIRVLNVSCRGPVDALWAAVLDELCPMNDPEESMEPMEIEAAMRSMEGSVTELARQTTHAASAMFDHLAQVLDPEEREALNAAFEEPGVPVATPRIMTSREIKIPVAEERPAPVVVKKVTEQATAKALKEATTPLENAASKEVVTPREMPRKDIKATTEEIAGVMPRGMPALRAFDLEEACDRGAQWQAVERSIWDLSPNSALLEARPPMSWASETCIAIDGKGRVNVWTLYRDGTSWFALREWAHEHRNILALTRRDLVVDKEAEVAVHIVLPLEDGNGTSGAEVIPTLMRTAARGIQVYRLRHVSWNNRRGLIVVPIS